MKISKKDLTVIIKEEIALVRQENILREHQLLIESQIEVLTELKEEGVITEEQLQEIIRALKGLGRRTKARIKGALGAAGTAFQGLRQDLAGIVSGQEAVAAAAQEVGKSFKDAAKAQYELGKTISRLTDHKKEIKAVYEDFMKDMKLMAIAMPAVKNRKDDPLAQIQFGLKVANTHIGNAVELMKATKEAAKQVVGKDQKALPVAAEPATA
jgi:hypothetical protein